MEFHLPPAIDSPMEGALEGALPRDAITGMVLAGGRGMRMGGQDKGLQLLHGQPLVQWMLQCLVPQVHNVAVNANRNRAAYARLGVPVWPDAIDDFQGPMAGFATGLAQMRTPWLLTVPCDTPLFPPDLAQRLLQATQEAGSALAMAATPRPDGSLQPQPMFCLMHRRLAASLQASLDGGERSAWRWALQQGCPLVPFVSAHDDVPVFRNINTLKDLQQLQALVHPPISA